LKYLSIRDVFPTEDKDFTPWLKNNIGYVEDALGMDFKDADTEVPVGKYFCDIMTSESNMDTPVVIENQYGTSDHDHLGKLQTYTAGKDAGIAIWICESFMEEHIAAIDHLNDNSKSVSYFALQIEVLQIDDSPPAISFNVLAKPNNWKRSVNQAANTNSYYLFFGEIAEACQVKDPAWPRPNHQQNANWYTYSGSISTSHFYWRFPKGGGIEVMYTTRVERYQKLIQNKNLLEKEFGAIIFDEKEKRSEHHIIIKHPDTSLTIDRIMALDEKAKAAIVKWCVDIMVKFERKVRTLLGI
jgi:hypothetical protein